jgi:anti-sigma factor RsiW
VKHPEIRAQLSAYLERDLGPEERTQIDTHLESCVACGSELRELRATVSLLRRLPEPGHPPGLADAVMARAAQRPARVIQLVRRAAEPRFAAALAAGIAGLVFLVDGSDPGRSTAPTATAPIGLFAHSTTLPSQPAAARVASAAPREARSARSFGIVLGDSDAPRASAVRPVRARVMSSATPRGAYDQYARRARIEEVARLLRGAGHPYSDSLASHFEEPSTVAMADWHPR